MAKCILRYDWVKLPRTALPEGKGVMGSWMLLAASAAFRKGQSRYCQYINDVTPGTWVGGIVGLKRILGVRSRRQALKIMDILESLGYIDFTLDPKTKRLCYRIKDWVLSCCGAPCADGVIYATDGYGFLCLPRTITQRLVSRNYRFEETDAWLDLWCHTVWQEPRNAFSYLAPTVQFGAYGAVLTLETLGQRWGWEKTKVWRFLKKHLEVFSLYRLPGSYGCLIWNKQYPVGAEVSFPNNAEIVSILDRIRISARNTHITGTDHVRLNKMILWYSRGLVSVLERKAVSDMANSRVALSDPIIRAYISLCWNCKSSLYDCKGTMIECPQDSNIFVIRGPCAREAFMEEPEYENDQPSSTRLLLPMRTKSVCAYRGYAPSADRARDHRGSADRQRPHP